MPRRQSNTRNESALSAFFGLWRREWTAYLGGASMILLAAFLAASLLSFSISDPSLNNATPATATNWGGPVGAIFADLLLLLFGGTAMAVIPPLVIWGGYAVFHGTPEDNTPREAWWRLGLFPVAIIGIGTVSAILPQPVDWPFVFGMGGVIGDKGYGLLSNALAHWEFTFLMPAVLSFAAITGLTCYAMACGLTVSRLAAAGRAVEALWEAAYERVAAQVDELTAAGHDDDLEEEQSDKKRGLSAIFAKLSPQSKHADDDDLYEDADQLEDEEWEEGDEDGEEYEYEYEDDYEYDEEDLEEEESAGVAARRNIVRETPKTKPGRREAREMQPEFPVFDPGSYELPPLSLLAKPKADNRKVISDDALDANARMLENVLSDFGVRGEIINVRPGPVVTLYELEPAAGVKSSRVIGLADDIARSMSAVAARVAVVPGRNAIGIELPNQDREMVYVRELLGASEFENTRGELTLSLGKSIGGEPIFADLAKMPHLLIAGTTGSGKSVGINTMILSLLYRLSPDHCKMIMIDPKMLELSVYDSIPHLLAPVVTDPGKAVVALKWTVREMEERYKRMSKVGVRNITGFNQRIAQAEEEGETLTRKVHTGYDPESNEPVYEVEELDYEKMPFIVVVIDEVADLMMVAGKDIEGMVQRLAQMARAAGIHLIMATQRPSVDVITGTIKANFPTRISFQVTSKIDSRTILGEQGAEQLLGQGDMLYMAGGGRVKRVHGGFVSDDEVEKIVKFLKKQGKPSYVQEVTELRDEDGGLAGLDIGGNTSSGDAMYDKALAIVLRDRKVSTSYIQRRMQIGYNRAATLIERMEEEGVISPANHAGKREILIGEDAA